MKPYHRNEILLLLLVVLFAGCNLPQNTPPQTNHPPAAAPDPGETPTSPAPAASPTPFSAPSEPLESSTLGASGDLLHLTPVETTALPPAPPRPQYTISIQLDYRSHLVEVEQHTRYPNHTGGPLDSLVLAVEPNRYPGAFQLKTLAWGDGRPVEGFSLERNRLTLPLPAPMQAGETADLFLAYTLSLPPILQYAGDIRPNPFGYTDRQTNLLDWYAFFPPYHPEQGWLIHRPWAFGEHTVYESADFQIDLELVGDLPAENGLTLAASAVPQRDGNLYRYRLENARTFALSASDAYQVVTQTVGTVTIYSYSFPFGFTGGEAALYHTAQALSLYEELLGPYPHESLSVVEADFLDGMEYEGLYFLSNGFYNTFDDTPKNYLTAIAVHETAHQWWYGQVGNDQALEPWLDEALCTYMERLYYERYFPELVDWWWAFRVNYYEPVGWLDQSIYDYEGFIPYRNAVYLLGARFLEELRQQMGDEWFFAFLKSYAGEYAGGLATTDGFFSLLDAQAGDGWRSLAAPYFSRLNLPQ